MRQAINYQLWEAAMKTAELAGAQLDCWVAQGMSRLKSGGIHIDVMTATVLTRVDDETGKAELWAPSSNWSQGGPIIERERIELVNAYPEWAAYGHGTASPRLKDAQGWRGPTPLVAAMRAYVASKFGDEVPDQPLAARPPIPRPWA